MFAKYDNTWLFLTISGSFQYEKHLYLSYTYETPDKFIEDCLFNFLRLGNAVNFILDTHLFRFSPAEKFIFSKRAFLKRGNNNVSQPMPAFPNPR